MERRQSRRRFLALVGAGAGSLAGCGSSSTPTETTEPRTATGDGDGRDDDTTIPNSVALQTVVDGLDAPLAIAFPSERRRYVAEQTGLVHVHEDGRLRDEPLLDLRDATEVGGEKGLLGIALHPAYPEDRRLFVRYSAPPREDTPRSYSHTFVLASFALTADGTRARRDSERTLLEIPEPQSNHNAGDVVFGPDGLLYIAVGDGGGGGDQGRGHAEDWYDAVGGGNGQDVTENLLGSILRIDVDREDDGDGKPYAIPDDNPLVGKPGLDEHFAWGLRNPWRMAFDRGDLLVGDVGQNRYEEVDRVVAGGNYGWNVKEATHCYGADTCPDRTPADVRGGEPLRDPVIEYPHSGAPVSGISVIGGQVYRGSAVPGLEGLYVFGDLQAEGRLFVATPQAAGEGTWPTRTLDVEGSLGRLLSIGRGPQGEVYVLGTGGGEGFVARIAEGND